MTDTIASLKAELAAAREEIARWKEAAERPGYHFAKMGQRFTEMADRWATARIALDAERVANAGLREELETERHERGEEVASLFETASFHAKDAAGLRADGSAVLEFLYSYGEEKPGEGAVRFAVCNHCDANAWWDSYTGRWICSGHDHECSVRRFTATLSPAPPNALRVGGVEED